MSTVRGIPLTNKTQGPDQDYGARFRTTRRDWAKTRRSGKKESGGLWGHVFRSAYIDGYVKQYSVTTLYGNHPQTKISYVHYILLLGVDRMRQMTIHLHFHGRFELLFSQ